MVGDAGRGRPGPADRTAPRRWPRTSASGSVRDVAVGIHLGTIGEEALLGLAPVLLACRGDGDEVARDLVRRQADEICVMAVAAMRRLGLTGLATPVVLGGGLLTARDPLLTAGIADRIAAAAPRAEVSVVEPCRRSRARPCWGWITRARAGRGAAAAGRLRTEAAGRDARDTCQCTPGRPGGR